ncbi:MAG TPA: hypothetical protein VM055_01105 [Novosphingobium sp.]|nr:hypothetical protein [Novosphingobium sp.]
MQVALLSTLEPSVDDPATPRGLLRLGGRSLVQHQLSVALALGCERVICLAEGLPGELIALQHVAERGGASFQVAADGRAVARMVKPDDEMLVIADGLIAPAATLRGLVGTRPGLLVQPVESGIAAGYERIDLNHAGGGAMRLPGRLAANLAELPGDWNPVSALLRIAVQAGLRQVVLPQALIDDGRWALIRSEAEAHRLEPRWLRLHTAGAESGASGGPGAWISARLVERLGPALLHAGTRPPLIAAGAGIVAMLGLGLAWFGAPSAGFVLLGLAWLVRRAAALLGRIDRATTGRRRGWLRPEALFGWLLDAGFVLAATWRFTRDAPAEDALLIGAFAALTTFGLLRLVPRAFARRRWASWFDDRLLASLALAAASLSEVFDLALMAAGLILLAGALAAAHDGTASEEPSPERLTPP